MSQVLPHRVACPACQHEQRAFLYDSLQAHLLPHEREAILGGSFEAQRCGGCGHVFQPEHRALYVDLPGQLWVLMVPHEERPKVWTWERDLSQMFLQELSEAPQEARAAMANPTVRLVLGQAALTEAVFCAREGIEPSVLECAKLMHWRRALGLLLDLGPCVLRVRGWGSQGALRCRVDDLQGRPLREGVELAGGLLEEARERADEWRKAQAGLFGRPWCCASGELFPVKRGEA